MSSRIDGSPDEPDPPPSTHSNPPDPPEEPDLRLFDLVTDADLPHRVLIVRPPDNSAPLVEPQELRFLKEIESIHKGDTSNPAVGRFASAYDGLVQRMTDLLAWLAAILETVTLEPPPGVASLNVGVLSDLATGLFRLLRAAAVIGSGVSHLSVWLEKEVNIVILHDQRLLYEFCERFEIFGRCTAAGLLQRTYATMRTVILHPVAKFQFITLDEVPVEVVAMIASFADWKGQRNLAATSWRYQHICAHLAMKTASFAMLYDHDTFIEHQFSVNVMAYMRTMNAAIRGAVATCESVVSDFLKSELYVANVREIILENEWTYVYPSYISTPPPSILSIRIYGSLYNKFVDLLSSVTATAVRMRGFALTYPVLDCIGSHQTIRRLSIERCMPIIANVGGIDMDFQTRRADMFGLSVPDGIEKLDATMYSLTFLSIGFGTHPSMANRNWNVIALCLPTVLKHIFLYPAEAGAVVTFPHPDIWPSIATVVRTLEDVHIEGCHRDFVPFARMCSIDDPDNPGAWRRLKIRSMEPAYRDSRDSLIAMICDHQPNLRVLVIEGLRHVPSVIVHQIATACPNLESLSLMRRSRAGLTVNTLCIWNDPVQLYYSAVGRFPKLRDLCVNFIQNRYNLVDETFPPTDPDEAYETEQYEGEEIGTDTDDELMEELTQGNSLDQIEDQPAWNEPPVEQPPTEHHDPITVAFRFHRACPTLRSFAIRAESTVFRCTIKPFEGGASFGHVVNHKDDVEHTSWNPYLGDTWGDDIW